MTLIKQCIIYPIVVVNMFSVFFICFPTSSLGALSFTWGRRCSHTQCLPCTVIVGTVDKMSPL